MGVKWKYVWGTVTITVIIGGTIYAIKKSKDAEKAEEKAISLKEAREIVEKHKQETETLDEDETVHFDMQDVEVDDEDFEYDEFEYEEVELQKDKEEKPKVRILRPEDLEDDPEEDYEDVDEHIEGPSIEPLVDFYYIEEGIDPKEDKTLRFEPNSDNAKHQFIRMELSDWEPNEDPYRILLQMFEFPFIPTTDGDEVLRTQVIDYKVQFFGFESKWVKEVSFADIVLHYGRLAEFNCGESVRYWVDYFLLYTGLEWDSTSQEIDMAIKRLNSHSYFNEERQTFGLFGLNRNAMDQAITIANGNIDRSVTYDIEFNEFLKSCV